MPKIYNKRKSAPAEYRNPPSDAVLVDRSSDYGNPFVIGKHGDRMMCLKLFEAYARKRLAKEPNWLDTLKGKDLIYWCAPDDCHADVLLRLANDDLFRSFTIRSNRVSEFGFRVKLCEGELNKDSIIRLMWTGNEIREARTDEKTRVQLSDTYDSLDTLVSALENEDVRCIYWQDTREYQYINRK